MPGFGIPPGIHSPGIVHDLIIGELIILCKSSILVNILVYTIHLDHCLAICVMDSNI